MEQKYLYDVKSKCCGCGACQNICPKQAISMIEDEYGYIYPQVDLKKCIECGLCKKVCNYQKNIIDAYEPICVYAVSSKNDKAIMQSSSGGVFAALAEVVLNDGGAVYGAAYATSDGGIIGVEHIRVVSAEDLIKLQGSKYVHSKIGNIYSLVKRDLQDNRKVLFSGTPCQVAGLRGFLGKDYKNLVTVDIVCHGVPSQKLFQSMIDYYKEQFHGKIVDFSFREKTRGWSDFYARVDVMKNKNVMSKYIHCKNIAYYQYFLDSDIYRENCYSCKYACHRRMGDITLGDFWGVEEVHSDLFEKTEWKECLRKGISCVLINTDNGEKIFDKITQFLIIQSSTYEKVSKENGQLRECPPKSSIREELLSEWMIKGYGIIQEQYKRKMGLRFQYIKFRKSVAPFLKSILRRR